MGRRLKGGEVIELISDLGGGKTVFVRGLARGIGSKDEVASPTFTISRVYRGKSVRIDHYDFYRLSEPGVVKEELQESLDDKTSAVAIEWAQTVEDVLPEDRLIITIKVTGENSRQFKFSAGPEHAKLIPKT